MVRMPQCGWCRPSLLLIALLTLPCSPLHAAQAFTNGQVVLEAESMPVKTTGGAVTSGWNIWSNGYIEDTVQFPTSGQYQFKVIARGDMAGGGWPIMEIRIDQVAFATIVVSSSTWTTYTATTQVSAGTHAVAIAFTNDYYVPPADRNLLVDKVTIIAPSSDTTPPTVSLSAPANGATVSGTAVTVSATASDNVGVAGVQFKLDGANLGAEDTTSPYSVSWDTTKATNGSHTLTAVARDAAGNSATSASRTVTVSNAPADTTPPTGSVTINGGAAGTNNVSVTLTLSATDNVGVTQMQFSNDNTTFSPIESYSTAPKAWTLATGDGTKTVWVKFRDAAGNSVTVSDAITLDTTPPVLSFTSPTDGAVITVP